MKIASWNVNSLRVRLPQVLEWLKVSDVDVLAIQETKVEDSSFPINDITDAGYHCDFIGQKTYNGVTTISKIPPKESVKLINNKEQDQKRFLLTRYGKNLTVLNLYVVNGHEVGSEKYKYKLSWLKKITKTNKDGIQNLLERKGCVSGSSAKIIETDSTDYKVYEVTCVKKSKRFIVKCDENACSE